MLAPDLFATRCHESGEPRDACRPNRPGRALLTAVNEMAVQGSDTVHGSFSRYRYAFGQVICPMDRRECWPRLAWAALVKRILAPQSSSGRGAPVFRLYPSSM